MIYNILILGCGNLGKRYLEGIIKSKLNLNIYLVETDSNTYSNLNKNISNLNTEHKIFIFKSIHQLKQKYFNLLINSTPASGRFKLIEKCILKFKIDNLILEKVLENNIDELKKFEGLRLKNCWVNTFLRTLKIFRDIKNLENKYIRMEVKGGNWGLLCNAIHYIDLVSWLIDKEPEEILTKKLSQNLIKSKRKGFVEIYGKLKVKYDVFTELELICDNSNKDLEILFESNIIKFKYNLINGKFESVNKEGLYKIPYQSEMSKDLIENILIKNYCNLTEIDESIKLHQIFISKIVNFSNSIKAENLNYIPIT